MPSLQKRESTYKPGNLFFAHPVFPDVAISSPCFFSSGNSVDEGIKHIQVSEGIKKKL
jgi:hypothetical protein